MGQKNLYMQYMCDAKAFFSLRFVSHSVKINDDVRCRKTLACVSLNTGYQHRGWNDSEWHSVLRLPQLSADLSRHDIRHITVRCSSAQATCSRTTKLGW